MDQEIYHIPALLPQTIEALAIKPGGHYVDATFGGGGHSRAILEALQGSGQLYSFDQDNDALERAKPQAGLTLIHGNFRFLSNFLRYYKALPVDGILADLGVSFHHFDDGERGFSFRSDGPLDMRMNRSARLTAATVLNSYSPERIADLLYLYGELRQSRRLAAAIVKAREAAPLQTISQLLDIVRPMVNPRQEKKELAQIFQALRIEVNGELSALSSFLEQACDALRPGGRLAIITYHSLEDRLVKNFIKCGNIEGRQDKDFFGRVNTPLRAVNNKPIVPDAEEVERNPRSRSAKLRVAEKQPLNLSSPSQKKRCLND